MSTQDFDVSRRRFFGRIALAGVGAIAAQAGQAQGGMPELPETDPTAAALGYKADTSKVDGAKYPNHKPDQTCAGCNLVQGKDGDQLRPCAIFPGKSVRANGWCAAFVA